MKERIKIAGGILIILVLLSIGGLLIWRGIQIYDTKDIADNVWDITPFLRGLLCGLFLLIGILLESQVISIIFVSIPLRHGRD